MTKRKKRTVIATYILAGFLVMGGFLLRERAEAARYRREAALNYSYSFNQLATSMEELSSALQKATYASSPSMLSYICTEAYAKASAAQAALVGLPYSNAELEHTAAFVTKVGDWAAYLSRRSAAGGGYTAEDRANMISLAAGAHTLASTLTELNAGVLGGRLDLSALENGLDALGETDDSAVSTDMASSFKKMEVEFPELPTLIYDGPFSEHLKTSAPKLAEGKKEIGEEDALYVASGFTGLQRNRFSVAYVRESDLPVYALTAEAGRNTVNLEITKQGGFVLYYGTNRPVNDFRLTADEAVRYAESFLKSRGITSMQTTYYTLQNNILLINFAYAESGVICYPDLVKVSVAMDNGEIVGFESTGYVMCHTKRAIPAAKVPEDEAAKLIAPGLTVLSHQMTIIPTGGKNEVYCHEFKCEDAEGAHCIIYVNAETGVEENILILIEDENGTLTM